MLTDTVLLLHVLLLPRSATVPSQPRRVSITGMKFDTCNPDDPRRDMTVSWGSPDHINGDRIAEYYFEIERREGGDTTVQSCQSKHEGIVSWVSFNHSVASVSFVKFQS